LRHLTRSQLRQPLSRAPAQSAPPAPSAALSDVTNESLPEEESNAPGESRHVLLHRLWQLVFLNARVESAARAQERSTNAQFTQAYELLNQLEDELATAQSACAGAAHKALLTNAVSGPRGRLEATLKHAEALEGVLDHLEASLARAQNMLPVRHTRLWTCAGLLTGSWSPPVWLTCLLVGR
jgi:hypothetical protein